MREYILPCYLAVEGRLKSYISEANHFVGGCFLLCLQFTQQEQLKIERKTVSRKQREAEKQRQFELKQQKRKYPMNGVPETLSSQAMPQPFPMNQGMPPGL